MPKGFTESGKPIMTKEEFLEQCVFDMEMRETRQKKQRNKKAIEQFNEDNKKEMAKLNKHLKQPTTTKIDNKIKIAQMYANLFTGYGYNTTIDKASIMITNANIAYELKVSKKNEPYTVSEYKGTKDSAKNKLIQLALEAKYDNYIVEVVDKTGLVGLNDGTTFYAVKFTKKTV